MKSTEDLSILASVWESAYVRVVLVEDVSLVLVSGWCGVKMC